MNEVEAFTSEWIGSSSHQRIVGNVAAAAVGVSRWGGGTRSKKGGSFSRRIDIG
jgi:hypothetical protein